MNASTIRGFQNDNGFDKDTQMFKDGTKNMKLAIQTQIKLDKTNVFKDYWHDFKMAIGPKRTKVRCESTIAKNHM